MIRIHKDDYVPKYVNGKWHFNKKFQLIEFFHYDDLASSGENYMYTNGFRFRRTLNQIEELTFRQEYIRLQLLNDADVVLLKDIRNLVCFLMPKSFLRRDFLGFLFSTAVTNFWHALVIYFEYFLKMVEYVLVRREEVAGDVAARIQSTESTDIKVIYSNYLSQYRLLLAREYSIILLGEGEMEKYYHIKPIVNISMTIKDKHFFEHFLAVSQQIVWIAMHRRAYHYIDAEMGRLFRSEHFLLSSPNPKLKFTRTEADLLYGKSYRRVNYRVQNSPLIQELKYVSPADSPILWISERKYRGTDKRIAALELEYIVPDSQLRFIDVTHGILGHPKKFYNTLLQLDWNVVRAHNYTEVHDPYRFVRQPYLEIPSIDEEKLREQAEHYESYYQLIHLNCAMSNRMLKKWLHREHIVRMSAKGRLLTSSIKQARAEIEEGATTFDELEGIFSRIDLAGMDLRKNKMFQRKADVKEVLKESVYRRSELQQRSTTSELSRKSKISLYAKKTIVDKVK